MSSSNESIVLDNVHVHIPGAIFVCIHVIIFDMHVHVHVLNITVYMRVSRAALFKKINYWSFRTFDSSNFLENLLPRLLYCLISIINNYSKSIHTLILDDACIDLVLRTCTCMYVHVPLT